jgi:hypothetical protein
VFGFGPVAKSFVEKFRSLNNYGIKFRIHVVMVNDLKEHPETARDSNGYSRLNDEYLEDDTLALNVLDDFDWLRRSGYEGHDVIVDCSAESDYFAEEIEYQMSTNLDMLLYTCTDLDSVDATIEKLAKETALRSKSRE